MNKTSKILLASAMTLSFSAVMAEKTLNIGVEGAYPPFSETTKTGEVIGFDIDIAKALCVEMKRKCKMVKTDWDGLIPSLKNRKIDAIIASMSATPEREKSIDFTDRYYRVPVKVIRKKGSGLEFTKDSMKGKVIGVQTSTTFAKHMKDLFGDVATINDSYVSNDEALLDLRAGRVDAVAAESPVLRDGFLKKEEGKDYEFFGPDLVDEKYYGKGIAIGIRKNNNKLATAFNNAIKTILENGKYKEINDKYFDFDIYGGK